MPRIADSTIRLLAGMALIGYALIAALFVWHDGLATFASDSGNYLLMARYLSPWQEASEAIRLLWDQQYFPPLFPLLLGLSGLSYHLAGAHLFTLALLLAALPLLHRYWQSLVPGSRAPLVLSGLFLLSPGTWLNIMGILSENLYLLLSLAVLVLPHRHSPTLRQSLMTGLLLAALMLTRSIGLALVGAWALSQFLPWQRGRIGTLAYILPVLVAAFFTLLNQWWQPQPASAFYLSQIDPGAIATQLGAFNELWHTAWQFYRSDSMLLQSMLVTGVGCLALAGLALRLRDGQLDAWYVLLYLLILLVWPYPGQGLRFLYVIQPVLLGQAWYALHVAGRHFLPDHASSAQGLFLLLLAAVVVPAQFFVLNRYQAGRLTGYAHSYEFYNHPDLPDATAAAAVQQALFNDMQMIRDSTPPGATIAWFEPVYLPVLADRRGSNLADVLPGSTESAASQWPDYLFVSRFHPRYTVDDYDGLVMLEGFADIAEIRWASRLPDGSTGAVLLEMSR
jgi:hypothetical protein